MGTPKLGASSAVDGGLPASPAPVTTVVANIWIDVLGLDTVAPEANFFELGGDSLAAVRMLAAVEDALLVPVAFTDFLDGPTVSDLVRAISAAGGPAPEPAPALASDAGPAPCSFAQERLWFLEQLGGCSVAYNMPIGTRIPRELDTGALRQAISALVTRHEALRTAFATDGGRVVARVGAAAEPRLESFDLRAHDDPEGEARRLADELVSRSLDLERGPLMGARLMRVGETDHILELVFAHIVCDGFSQVVIMRELGELYAAYARGTEPALAPPRVQYADFARAERAELDEAALEREIAPWLQRLRGAPEAIELPTDHARPATPTYRGATYRRRLSPETAAAVRAFAREHRATPFATLLAAYYALLYRHSGQDDIVIGATTSGREGPGQEDGVGLWASTVALRCEFDGETSFAALVAQVREVVLWAVAHQKAPFEQIVARLGLQRDLSRHPLFGVFCAHVPLAPAPVPGARPYDVQPQTSRFDLTLFVEEEPEEELELAWEYSTDLFEPATVEALAERYVRLLEAGLRAPEHALDSLELLDDLEVGVALDRGRRSTAEYPVACMHERFEHHAAARPQAVALTLGADSLTYGELNARANQLAHRLRELGVGPDSLVALFLAPSLELVVAVLGVLKAGGAYLPLDPEYPPERIEFVLGDAEPRVVVTHAAVRDRLPLADRCVICLDADRGDLERQPPTNPPAQAAAENLAYVIYTSGSTGRPKGVLVEHRNVARLFTATVPWFGFGPHDTWVMLHSYAFDFSVWELWGALAHGGRLVLSPVWTTRSPSALADLVAGEGVTVLNATPSLFVAVQDELIARASDLDLRYVVFGGEALRPSSLRPWFARFGDTGATLVNMYGITETTVHVTYRPLRAADADGEGSPIGVPIPDLDVFILDRRGQPVPPGVAGELFIGGFGVARGYLNRPDLTAERFVDNPFGPGRLYRSGDVARWLPDGELEFRGRADEQVKIRGFRIELGEIASVLREVPDVADCAVVAVEVEPGDTRLAGYLVPAAEREAALVDEAFAALGQKLPAYMVPASLDVIDRIPLTRNGKLDRRALPPPSWQRGERVSEVPAAQSETERTIAEIWQRVLAVDAVAAQDNFFNLGGHSLLAARVVTLVRKRCQVDISVRALFSAPTLGAFAAAVDAARAPAPPDDAAAAVDAAPPPRAAEAPLSFPQQQLLFFDELSPGSTTYNAALPTRVRGPLDLDALRAALHAVFERHEALRTVLSWQGDTPHQTVLDRWSLEVPLIDLSELPDEAREAELERQARERALTPFDLTRDLMLRTTVFRLADDEHVILFGAHHIAFDAWAVEVLYRELAEAYDAHRAGRAPALPVLSAQYRDFATWQRERLQGDFLNGELAFWRRALAGAPTVLRLPTDRPRPAQPSFDGATHVLELGSEPAERVRTLCAQRSVTPYMLLLATFATLLYRRSGQDDILFGGPMANRQRSDLESLIGFFANTVVVRAQLGGDPPFAELLGRVKDAVLGSYEHQEVPLELVVDAVRPAREPGLNPLFQVNFRVRVGQLPSLVLPGLRSEPVTLDLGLARFDLALELHLRDDRLRAEFNYNRDLFDAATIEQLAGDFAALLEQVVAAPGTRLLSFAVSDAGAAPAPPRVASIRGFRGAR